MNLGTDLFIRYGYDEQAVPIVGMEDDGMTKRLGTAVVMTVTVCNCARWLDTSGDH